MLKKIFLCFSCIVFFVLSGCSQTDSISKRQIIAFDTIIQIQLYDTKNAEELLDQCIDKCKYYEDLFSRTKEGSDIYRMNHSKGSPVSINPETAKLLEIALSYCKLSEGAFDITLAPISDLWNFQGDSKEIPPDTQINKLLAHAGYENIQLTGTEVILLDPETQIDLGGIAKGYVADQLKVFLKEQGVEHALIDLGGNILALGGKPDGSPFHIAIQKPFDGQGNAITSVKIADKSVVSSGNYQRYFEKDGQIYHHILNPSTGHPCKNELCAVTIIAPNSVDADALSTTCFVLGLEKGTALIESLNDTEAIFITHDFNIISVK